MFAYKILIYLRTGGHQLLISDIIAWFNFSLFPYLQDPTPFLTHTRKHSFSSFQPIFLPQTPQKYLLAICTQGASLANQQRANQARICISYGIYSREVHPGKAGRILSSWSSMGRNCPLVCNFLKGLGYQARMSCTCRETWSHYLQWLE